MKELSLNILDVAENSVKARATLTQILLSETADTLTLTIADDGCGMDAETVRRVTDPFYTTRTTRSVGLELPQLVNILRGELSIVGPRPIVTEELERYGENKTKFLSVIPGLTGYWQAYARSSCTYEQRMEMELYYVEHANFWWDIKIIFATVGAVLCCRGAQ